MTAFTPADALQNPGCARRCPCAHFVSASGKQEEFVASIKEVNDRLGRCLVAVSEGIRNAAGELFLVTAAKAAGSSVAGGKDSHGNVQMGGTGALGDALAGLVKGKLGGRVRADTFGYIQRNFPVDTSPVDYDEAFMCGQKAIEAAASGTMSGSAGECPRQLAPAACSCSPKPAHTRTHMEVACHDRSRLSSAHRPTVIRRLSSSPYKSEAFITPLDTVAKVTKEVPKEWLVGAHAIGPQFAEYCMPLTGGIAYMTDLAGKKAVPPS